MCVGGRGREENKCKIGTRAGQCDLCGGFWMSGTGSLRRLLMQFLAKCFLTLLCGGASQRRHKDNREVQEPSSPALQAAHEPTRKTLTRNVLRKFEFDINTHHQRLLEDWQCRQVSPRHRKAGASPRNLPPHASLHKSALVLIANF
jgi:hypothetical protein